LKKSLKRKDDPVGENELIVEGLGPKRRGKVKRKMERIRVRNIFTKQL